ncbi:MAG TPA: DUF3551 domain-containing protein [Xanthobacteraceae bacterium]|jgi:hypothetical protein
MPRIPLAIAAAALGLAALATTHPADAQNRRWCTEKPAGSWGFPDCSYDTYWQCHQSALGTGRFCVTNPWLGRAQTRPQPRYRYRRPY